MKPQPNFDALAKVIVADARTRGATFSSLDAVYIECAAWRVLLNLWLDTVYPQTEFLRRFDLNAGDDVPAYPSDPANDAAQRMIRARDRAETGL